MQDYEIIPTRDKTACELDAELAEYLAQIDQENAMQVDCMVDPRAPSANRAR